MLRTTLIRLKNRLFKQEPRNFLLKLMPQHTVGAEIGVWRGNFSHHLLRVVQPKHLHLIDPYSYRSEGNYQRALYGGKSGSQISLDDIYNSVKRRFKTEIDSGQVVLHRQTSETAVHKFPDHYFDWVYIDGDHQYEFVKKDLELFSKKVKTGGLIAGDDYEDRGWWQGGVKKAVDEFVTNGAAKIILIKKNQFVLRKR